MILEENCVLQKNGQGFHINSSHIYYKPALSQRGANPERRIMQIDKQWQGWQSKLNAVKEAPSKDYWGQAKMLKRDLICWDHLKIYYGTGGVGVVLIGWRRRRGKHSCWNKGPQEAEGSVSYSSVGMTDLYSWPEMMVVLGHGGKCTFPLHLSQRNFATTKTLWSSEQEHWWSRKGRTPPPTVLAMMFLFPPYEKILPVCLL